MSNRVLLFLVVLLLPALTLSAETLYLKDGSVLKGTITATDDTTVTMQTAQGQIVVQKSDIDHIDYNDSAATSPSNSPPPKHTLDQAFFVNPLSMLVAPIVFDTVEVNFGAMVALNKWLLLGFTNYFDFGQATGVNVSEDQAGLYVNPFGTYLNGLYFGVVAAYSTFSTYVLPSAFSLMAQLGFGWAFDPGMYVCGFLGYSYTFPPYGIASFKYGILVGLAWNGRDLDRALFPGRTEPSS